MATKLKILTLADGFGDSWACPPWFPQWHKWPALIGLMTQNTEIIDLSRYGSGNEYLVNCLRHNYHQADVTFLQWTVPARLDLVLAHEPDVDQLWHQCIDSDIMYRENFQYIGQHKWWISSASDQPWVREYHRRFISKTQHQLRSEIWIEYAHKLLKDRPHNFLLTYDSEYLRDIDVPNDVWIWHEPWKGMHDWRNHSQFRDLDFGLVQPIPLIHFDFIKRFIVPKCDLPWRNERELQAVESMLKRKYNQYKEHRLP